MNVVAGVFGLSMLWPMSLWAGCSGADGGGAGGAADAAVEEAGADGLAATDTADAGGVSVADGPVQLPGGQAGVGFDDLRYSTSLGRVLVPGGGTGGLVLIDPDSLEAQSVTGFSQVPGFRGGHDDGPTSVDEGVGLLFVTDRTAGTVVVVDAASLARVAETPLTGGPDYVRYVAATRELWVTEPGQDRIEVLSLPEGATPTPQSTAFIDVPGGPESLVVDVDRGIAYTHLWAGQSVAIDVSSRQVVGQWANGCHGSRGIALDGARQLLFAGCAEGLATVMDLEAGGAVVDQSDGGGLAGVDVIGYDPGRHHLFVAGATSATLAILDVADDGHLTLLGAIETTAGADCVTADDQGHAFWCDPAAGEIHRLTDPY